MYYELALISVVIAAGYWGAYFVRAEAVRTYGVMLLGAAALAALGLYGHRTEDAPTALGLAGAVGVGAGACLLVVGPVVRAVARRFAAAERFGIAQRLLDVADVLAPGSGVAEEKSLLAAMREISGGHVDQTIGALTAAKGRAPAEARLAIDERIAMLYLAAYRWDEAIAHAEAHLLSAAADAPRPTRVDPTAPHGAPGPAVALRRALGVAPPVWVELLGAYGYTGDLEQAARMLARLEDVCAGRDDAAVWIHRGRMMFLALAGRVAAVEALVAPRAARHMSRSARTYWHAVALDRHGDGRAAHAAYEKARAQARGRPRQLIDRALERMPDAQMIDLPPLASELVARVEAAAPPAVAVAGPPPAPWATVALCAALVATAGAIALFVGDSNDLGVLLRAGAMARQLVVAGEWWRVVSCIFVHAGGLHLLVNLIGLWFLGRLCEQLFGAARTVAIFAVSGLASSAASYVAAPIGVSFGASGAVLGVLGALFVELTLGGRELRSAGRAADGRRGSSDRRLRRTWRRSMWGRVALVAVAQIAVDFEYPSAIQLAHATGLLAGTLAGFLLAPAARRARVARIVAIAIGGAFAAACVLAAVLVVGRPLGTSLGTPDRPLAVGDVTLRAPAGWTGGAQLEGPAVDGWFALGATPNALADWTAAATKKAHDDFDQVDVATATLVPLPPGWQGSELVVAAEMPDGGRRTWRRILAGKPLGDGRIALAALDVPDGMARAAPELFTALLATVAAR